MAVGVKQGWHFGPQGFSHGGRRWPQNAPPVVSLLQKADSKPPSSERKPISEKRYKGKLQEWNKKYGWIQPLEDLDLPPPQKPGRPKVYVAADDLQRDIKIGVPAVGMLLEFAVYKDIKGVGAFLCTQVSEASNLEDEEEAVGDPEAAADDSQQAETEEPASESAVAGADANSNGNDPPLPEGWERHWSAEHHSHFYWHGKTQETRWIHPSLGDELVKAAVEHAEVDTQSAAVTDESAPRLLPGLVKEGWETHFDEQRERWYYWNRLTQESSWEEPAPRKAGSSSQATGAGGGSAATSAGSGLRSGAAVGSQAVPGPARGVSDGEDDRIRGRILQWKRLFAWITPLEELEADLQPMLKRFKGCIYANRRDTAAGLDAEMEVDFVLKRDQHGLMAASVRPFQEAAACTGPDDSEQLPPGWSRQWSEEHGCHYYWNEVTKEPSWERPSLPSTEDQEVVSIEPEPADDQMSTQNGDASMSSRDGGKQPAKGGKQPAKGGLATGKSAKGETGSTRLAGLAQSKGQSKGKSKGKAWATPAHTSKAGSPQPASGKPAGKRPRWN